MQNIFWKLFHEFLYRVWWFFSSLLIVAQYNRLLIRHRSLIGQSSFFIPLQLLGEFWDYSWSTFWLRLFIRLFMLRTQAWLSFNVPLLNTLWKVFVDYKEKMFSNVCLYGSVKCWNKPWAISLVFSWFFSGGFPISLYMLVFLYIRNSQGFVRNVVQLAENFLLIKTRKAIDIGICLVIDGGWSWSTWMYIIRFFVRFVCDITKIKGNMHIINNFHLATYSNLIKQQNNKFCLSELVQKLIFNLFEPFDHFTWVFLHIYF